MNDSFLLNTMTEKTTSFQEDIFEKKRNIYWTTSCQGVNNMKEPEFEKDFRPRSDQNHLSETRPSGEGPQKNNFLEETKSHTFPKKIKSGHVTHQNRTTMWVEKQGPTQISGGQLCSLSTKIKKIQEKPKILDLISLIN